MAKPPPVASSVEKFGAAPHERPVPRISIHAFCEFPDTGAALQRASADRRLSKAHLQVQLGGVNAAIEHYTGQITPNLLIVETKLDGQEALGELDRLGLREHTIVVFVVDHGYQLGEKGKWSKAGSLFEMGTRVPLIISAPGMQGNGQTCERIVESLDIYPTVAELAGLPAQKENEGVSLLPLLLYTAGAGGNYQIASITALLLLIPSIGFMLVVERFLKSDVLSRVGR